MDPFDQNSPIKQAAIEKFPPDMFFVLRVVQLLRGMANGVWHSDDRGMGRGVRGPGGLVDANTCACLYVQNCMLLLNSTC